MSSPPGSLPQSSALSEASSPAAGDSLVELFSRDPEKLTPSDRARIIGELRAHRERLEKAAAAGTSAPKLKVGEKSLVATKNADEMGI